MANKKWFKGLCLIAAFVVLLSACGKAPKAEEESGPADETTLPQTEETVPETEAQLLAFLQSITAAEAGVDAALLLASFAAAIWEEQIHYEDGQRPAYFSGRLHQTEDSLQLTLYYREGMGRYVADDIYMRQDKVAVTTRNEVTASQAGVLTETADFIIFTRQAAAACPFEAEDCTGTYLQSELAAMNIQTGALSRLLPSRVYLTLGVIGSADGPMQVSASWYQGDSRVAFLSGEIHPATLTFAESAYREEEVDPADYHKQLSANEGVGWASLAGVPVSLTVNGVQQITGEENWYFDVMERIESLEDDEDRQVHSYLLDQSYTGKSPDYLTILSRDTVELYGDWTPFPVQVTWQRYTPSNQPGHTVWTDYIAALLKKTVPDSPVLITDVFYTDLDGDGLAEVIVNASNFFWTEHGEADGRNIPANMPAGGQTGCYSVTVLFSETLGDHTLSQWSETIPGTTDSVVSYGKYGEDTLYYNDFSSYQYDAQGNLIVSPVFITLEYYPPDAPYPVVFDCDGDGSPELLFVSRGTYVPCPVYKVINGKLMHSHSVIFPA